MGRDKALVEVDGVAMARRVADALLAAGARSVVAQGGDAPALTALALVVRADRRSGDGPLPATIQALEDARHDIVVVLSCDLLAPSPDAVAALVEALTGAPEAVAAIPVVDGHHQWTHAAWRTSAAPRLADRYAAGARSLRRAAADLAILAVEGITPAAVADADQPSDLPSDLP
jgi:molybdopterin-guanine dinucleotide biosynthesis protein A